MDGLLRNLPLTLAVLAAIVLVLVVPAGPLTLSMRRRAATRTMRMIGVGGAGCSVVDAMVRAKMRGLDFVACNTDAQALRESRAARRLQIGRSVTQGLGTGGDPALGRQAAEEDASEIGRALEGCDLVFIAAGLGGGTGSGATPVVATIARERGALTVGIVTRPFSFEGPGRSAVADQAVAELGDKVDTLITIPNDRVRDVVDDGVPILRAFAEVDDVVRHAVWAINDLCNRPGLVNLDFADVRAVMKSGGLGLVGVGQARGENRGAEAARQAISSPLLGAGIEGARRVLFSVTGSADLQLAEVAAAAEAIRASAHPAADVRFGASIDEALGDEVRVTVIATELGASRPSVERLAVLATAAADEHRAESLAEAQVGSAEVEAEVPVFLRRREERLQSNSRRSARRQAVS